MHRPKRSSRKPREARIAAGNQSIDNTFSQFDDNFYQGRSKAY
jgi:hypothetical protein